MKLLRQGLTVQKIPTPDGEIVLGKKLKNNQEK